MKFSNLVLSGMYVGFLAGCVAPPAIKEYEGNSFNGPVNESLVDENVGVLIDLSRKYISHQYIPFKASEINVTIHKIDNKSDYVGQSNSSEENSIGKGVIKLKAGKHQVKATCNGERWLLLSRWSILGSAIIDFEVEAGATYYIAAKPLSFSACDIYISDVNKKSEKALSQ